MARVDTQLKGAALDPLMKLIPRWSVDSKQESITRTFLSASFKQNVALINAAFWVADRFDHHFNLNAGYKACTIGYSTHTAKGITPMDILCASHIDLVFELMSEPSLERS